MRYRHVKRVVCEMLEHSLFRLAEANHHYLLLWVRRQTKRQTHRFNRSLELLDYCYLRGWGRLDSKTTKLPMSMWYHVGLIEHPLTKKSVNVDQTYSSN